MNQFRPNLDDKTRFLVLYLDAKMKPTRISRIINVPERTVQDWIQKTDMGIDVREVQPGRGRKPTKSPTIRRKILRTVSRSPYKYTTRRLGHLYDSSNSYVHGVLKGSGLKYSTSRVKHILNDDEKADRVAFCEDMAQNEGEKIYETFFSDEMGMKLSEAYPKKTWRDPQKKVEVAQPLKDVKLNCWGAISANGATSLHIFKGSQKASVYQGIIDEHLLEMDDLYPEGFYFQHDNHKTHTASENWLNDQDVVPLQFPTYSPDLNPIENVWNALKARVRHDAPKTEAQMKNSLIRNWEEITTKEALEPYFDDMVVRCEECMEIEGERLDR